jgi:hypothetical protein
MDCFAARAPLCKRLAFVAGNDAESVSIRISNSRYTSASRGGMRPRFACRCPSREGAGNAGCAPHPRSRVQRVEKKTHTSIQGSGGNPTFPAQWLYGLYRAHPGVSGFPASVASRNLALWPGRAFAPPKDLTPTTEASGPHDFTVRSGIVRLACRRPLTEFIPPCEHTSRPTPPRPPHPIPTFGDDGQRPFLGDRMA